VQTIGALYLRRKSRNQYKTPLSTLISAAMKDQLDFSEKLSVGIFAFFRYNGSEIGIA
jgi:hypothetical protein